MGSDETYELDFVLFDQRAYQIIEKSCERLQALYNRFDTPPERSALIGQKYTYIVKVSPLSIENENVSFEVLYVKEQFGKQTRIPTVQQNISTNIVLAAPTSATLTSKNHLPLVPIKPKRKEIQEVPKLQLSSTSMTTWILNNLGVTPTSLLQQTKGHVQAHRHMSQQ